MTARWTPQKALAGLEAVGALLSAVALALMLAATPPFECGSDYESPATPLHSGGIAFGCLVFAVIGVLLATGMALGGAPASSGRRWAVRAIALSLLALAIAGGAVFADLARWTCWP